MKILSLHKNDIYFMQKHVDLLNTSLGDMNCITEFILDFISITGDFVIRVENERSSIWQAIGTQNFWIF